MYTHSHLDPRLIQQFHRGGQLAREGRHADAVAEWDRLIAALTTDAPPRAPMLVLDARVRRSRSLAELGRWADVADGLSQPDVVSAFGRLSSADRFDVWVLSARALGRLGRGEEAVEPIHRALEVADEVLGDPSRVTRAWEVLLEALEACHAWPTLERQARLAITSAQALDLPALSFHAGWRRIRALRALGRGALAREQARALLGAVGRTRDTVEMLLPLALPPL